MKKRIQHNKEESRMVRSMDSLRLYEALMPAIQAVVASGGGADSILRKSEAMAAVQLVESLSSEKDDVKLKASIEILNRTVGRPVERSLNIYGDLSKMNEKDIDNQILRAIEKSGAQPIVEAALTEHKLLPKKRKPRKSDPLGTTEET